MMTIDTKHKRHAQRKHALNRADTRFNLVFSKAVRLDFLEIIRTKKSILMYKQSLRVSCYKINYQDTDYYVIYDKKRNEIVTFLTEEMVNDTLSKNPLDKILSYCIV